MKTILPLLALAALAPGAALAALNESAVRACAGIGEDAARLACYDAQVKATPAAPDAATQGTAPAAPAAAAPASVPPPVAPPAMAPYDGMIHAHVVNAVSAWPRGQRVVLDNGQIWKVVDDPHYATQPAPAGAAVSLRQNFFGNWWLKVDGTDFEIRVQPAK